MYAQVKKKLKKMTRNLTGRVYWCYFVVIQCSPVQNDLTTVLLSRHPLTVPVTKHGQPVSVHITLLLKKVIELVWYDHGCISTYCLIPLNINKLTVIGHDGLTAYCHVEINHRFVSVLTFWRPLLPFLWVQR